MGSGTGRDLVVVGLSLWVQFECNCELFMSSSRSRSPIQRMPSKQASWQSRQTDNETMKAASET